MPAWEQRCRWWPFTRSRLTTGKVLRLVLACSLAISTPSPLPHPPMRAPPSPTPSQEFKKLGVHVVAGDVTTPTTLVKAFAGATSVYIIVPGTEVGVGGLWCVKCWRTPFIRLSSVLQLSKHAVFFNHVLARMIPLPLPRLNPPHRPCNPGTMWGLS